MEEGLNSLTDGELIRALMILAAAVTVFFVHEFGHYMMARLCDVHVENVTIGFGRELWKRTDRRGTVWSLRLYPFCGFVHVAQDKDAEPGKKGIFCHQTVWKRFTVVAAGPLANIFFAWLILAAFFMAAGQPATPPVITGVEAGWPAHEAGFRVGDRITALDGRPVSHFAQIQPYIREVTGKNLVFTMERGDGTVDLTTSPRLFEYKNLDGYERSHGRIGVLAMHHPLQLKAIMTVNGAEAGGKEKRVRELLRENMDRDAVIGIKSEDNKVHNYDVFIRSEHNKDLFESDKPDSDVVFLGPTKHNFYYRLDRMESMAKAGTETGRLIAGIAGMAGRFAMDRTLVRPEGAVAKEVSYIKSQLFAFVWLAATLSLCVALLNCLPLPGFDGSFLLLCVLEALFGPERAEKARPYAIRLAVLCVAWTLMMINLETLALLIK